MRILVRGGGDLASGVVVRLHRAGWQVLVTELARPLAVRRYVSFAEAVYDGEISIEGVRGLRIDRLDDVNPSIADGVVPVLVDPSLESLARFEPHVLIDGRMTKRPPETDIGAAPLVIGLGPGFTAGVDCHAVVETNRGPAMGRVLWEGQAQADTGVPERVAGYQVERVLRAPADGVIEPFVEIGNLVSAGDLIAEVAGEPVIAAFDGVVRGLIKPGLKIRAGEKIGDIDPRGDPRLCWMVSDKALAVAGGVLEAILSWKPVRNFV